MTWCLGAIFSLLKHLALEEGVMITRKDWNEKGYDGLIPSSRRGGKPPRLKEKDIEILQELLQQRDFWTTKEVRLLILKEFDVNLSYDQVRRILRERLKMHFGKPYPRDYRRPERCSREVREGA
jgi:putative transposase